MLSKAENEWVSNSDDEFIGNINRMRHCSSYFDVETELYYQNAVFYNSINGAIVMNRIITDNSADNIAIAPLSYGEELDYEIYCMQQECLNNPDFNDAVSNDSDWAKNCSDIEVVARVIYGENTHVYIDQKAVACVIRNRAIRRKLSPREVVLEAGQFKAALPSEQAAKSQYIGEVGWANAVYLACLLCYTLETYDWEEIGAIPAGMGNQEYFRSKLGRNNFTQSGNTMYYAGAAICEVYGAGYGSISSCSQLDNFWNNRSDQNVHFSYVGGN